MGLYEVTDQAELPLAVPVGDSWQLHTRAGATVEVADEAASELGSALRRLDKPDAAAAPAEQPAAQPAEQPAAAQAAEQPQPDPEPQPARGSRRRPGGGDG